MPETLPPEAELKTLTDLEIPVELGDLPDPFDDAARFAAIVGNMFKPTHDLVREAMNTMLQIIQEQKRLSHRQDLVEARVTLVEERLDRLEAAAE